MTMNRGINGKIFNINIEKLIKQKNVDAKYHHFLEMISKIFKNFYNLVSDREFSYFN